MKPKNVIKKLKRRQDAYEQTLRNQRGKWTSGFHRPGSNNVKKQG